jgi:hypothetical protein
MVDLGGEEGEKRVMILFLSIFFLNDITLCEEEKIIYIQWKEDEH